MGNIAVGLNLVFVGRAEKSFQEGIELAAQFGYRYVEPCVATGYDLLNLGGYYHMLPMEDDPKQYKECLDQLGLKPSALSAHAGLMRPEVCIPYLTQAIRWASDIGAPVINTDEGMKPAWMSDDEAFRIMAYTVHQVIPVAERYGVKIGIEPHQNYTVRRDTFLRILDLSDSPCWGVNWDTGNYYLGGNDDPYAMLEEVAPRVVHMHAKDISRQQSDAERGTVTGTPVGCACGEGLIDWPRVIELCKKVPQDIVLCVECGTIDQAERSIKYLQSVI